MATVTGIDEGRRALQAWADGREGKVEQAMTYWARRWETTARTRAPWRDRTTAARRGLQAVEDFGTEVKIIHLTNQVDYGKYLELAHGKKYAVIVPTAIAELPNLIALIKAAL